MLYTELMQGLFCTRPLIRIGTGNGRSRQPAAQQYGQRDGYKIPTYSSNAMF